MEEPATHGPILAAIDQLRILLLTALCLVACSGDGDGDAASTTPSTAAPEQTTTTVPAPEPLTILVSNDDGYAAAGIDAIVTALVVQPSVEVVVVAPADDQTGSGDTTTPGPHEGVAVTTLSGYPATSVAGEPADSVIYGIGEVLGGTPPDLVVTGINHGQNLGPVLDLSGTVGAARTAARAGIPAVAVSQGFPGEGGTFDFAAGVAAFLDWFEANRDDLERGTFVSINAPTCAAGTTLRGTLKVPPDEGTDISVALLVADCASVIPATDVTNDVAAFNAGFVTVSAPGLD